MSEKAWTPGPWKWASAYIGSADTLYGLGGESVLEHAPYENMWFSAYGDEAKNAANARLMAAAPELYEALESAVECGLVPISSALNGGATRHSRQVIVADMIRAAIAKARGEA